MLANHLFTDTHRSRDINCEYNTYLLLSQNLFIVNLCRSFHDIGYLFCLWDLFRFNLDFVLCIAKLACPNLLAFWFLIMAVHVEGGVAVLAENWIASGKLWSMLECRHIDREHIRVYFLLKLFTTFTTMFWFKLSRHFSLHLDMIVVVLLVT